MTVRTASTDLTRAEEACVDGEAALARGDTAEAESRFGAALALVASGAVVSGVVTPDAGGGPAEGAATGQEGARGGAEDGDPPAGDGGARLAARARTGVGRVRLARGEGEDAEAEFERARALRPVAAGPLHWLGCAAAHRGDLAAAERHLSASLACAVPHPRSLVQRAYVRARAGDRDSALSDLRAATRAGQLDDEARWVLASLSDRPAREVALRLRRAALTALTDSGGLLGGRGGRQGPVGREPGRPGWEPGRSGWERGRPGWEPGRSGWERAGELIEAAWRLEVGSAGGDLRRAGGGEVCGASPGTGGGESSGSPRGAAGAESRGASPGAEAGESSGTPRSAGGAESHGASREIGPGGGVGAERAVDTGRGDGDAPPAVDAVEPVGTAGAAEARQPGGPARQPEARPGADAPRGSEPAQPADAPHPTPDPQPANAPHPTPDPQPANAPHPTPDPQPPQATPQATPQPTTTHHTPARPYAPLYAVALLHSRRRAVAVSLLGRAVQHDPTDHRTTHALALALLNSPSQGSSSSWESCVGAWASLLHDDRFWEHVLGAAARRYGVTVDAGLVPVLRAGLHEVLVRRMPGDDDAGTRVAPGPLLQREADAAKLLAAVGGFPSAGRGGVPLVCGPLRIAELGKSAEFGAFAAAQDAADPADPVNPTKPTNPTNPTNPPNPAYATDTAHPPATAPSPAALTYAFSELGFAQILLGLDKPADALAALGELRCPDCRARGGPGAAAVCEPGCARFDELNPGYAGLPHKHRRLSLDARGLALEARLRMGRAALIAARPDFAAAATYWRRALVHSREIDRYRETQSAIVGMALGAARAAHREGRLSHAVAALDATRSVIGANERARLEGQLARVLADRGISVANDGEASFDQPAADLRRSVAFNPHLLRAQVSLGIVLRSLAATRWTSGSLSGARTTLREAIDQLTAALAHFPDDPDLEEQREAAVADLNHVMWQPDESEQ
ncbi:hypothetical protein ACFVYR_05035 [Streptomyces sp. NPDC058284]|uniref:hypothetical protein n=1 Tax=unclassified Streptomyces TaxID=2593676 RepID=UPI0036626753